MIFYLFMQNFFYLFIHKNIFIFGGRVPISGNYILREKSLAIIYNGVSHTRSLKHQIFLIGRFANMSVV